MDLSRYSVSDGFFLCSEPLVEPGIAAFDSMRGRGLSLLNFFEKLAIVPFAFLFKLCRTYFRLLGLTFSALFLLVTLCSSMTVREFFVRRVAIFAADLADWVLWPIAVVSCLARLLLAAFVHPALYFGF